MATKRELEKRIESLRKERDFWFEEANKAQVELRNKENEGLHTGSEIYGIYRKEDELYEKYVRETERSEQGWVYTFDGWYTNIYKGEKIDNGK